ncbi:MAG: glycoside hydrolase family 1 protein [Anaerolineae bacterium]
MSLIAFPPDFLWGAATAAHQVEGQNFNNDWWDWEQTPGHIKKGYTSAIANNWYAGRYVEDFERARQLGIKAIRLSVEWSRVETGEGEWDGTALKYYRRMLQVMKESGLTPQITLHHFTNPRWLAAEGGWENPRTVQLFVRFVRRVVEELGYLCDFWVTLNEPNILATIGYLFGDFPPGKRNIGSVFPVLRHLLRAHAGAYYAIHDLQPNARVGVAHHFRPFFPHNPDSPLDRLTASLRDRVFNQLFFDAIETGRVGAPLGRNEYWPEVKGTQDFVGLNYYYTDHVTFNPSQANTFFGETVLDHYAQSLYELFPTVGNIELWGLEKVLGDLAKYGKPIYITENGVFDNGRNLQTHYLVTHLAALQRAIQAGADVRGYFWWTLVDNFEWNEGYDARFGLYHLDLETQARTPKPVAEVYAQVIRDNGVSDALMDQYGRPD